MNKIIFCLILSIMVATHSFTQTNQNQKLWEQFKHDYPRQIDIQWNCNSEGRFQQNEWVQLSDSSISEGDSNDKILNHLNVQSNQETKVTIDTLAILQTDSIKNVTEEQDNQKSEFGTKEKTAAIVTGAVAGFVIGAVIGDALTSTENNDLPVVDAGALLGGCVGLILGPFINYQIIEHLAEKSDKKELLDDQKNENSKKPKTDRE